MLAQIGADGLELFGDPMPELLAEVARTQPQSGGEWVNLKTLGFRSTQRVRISDLPGGGVVLATWPAELQPQARYLYGRELGVPLVSAAVERRWKVEPSPHLAFHTSPPSRRLYMRPAMDARQYAAQWQHEDALRRVGNHSRADVEGELWPWLKRCGYADDQDDVELHRFLEDYLHRRPAHMRPGLRFRRAWTGDEVSALGRGLAAAIRDEFNSVFKLAEEPDLGASPTPASNGEAPVRVGVSPRVGGAVRESISERVRHEVWRRDQGRCVDCGSRERLEYDHIIPISRGGSNTVRNIELRCETCNRRKGAQI
jgi:hypothetical protein